jgi:cobalt-zinc-cadmium efflux system outer membrane protein
MLRFFVVTTTLTAVLCAQNSPPSKITLAQGVQEALDKNLSLLAEKHNIAIADAKIVTARLRPNPVLSFSADHQNVLGSTYTLDNGAGPNEYSARVDFLLERGGKRERRVEVAEAVKAVAELQFLNSIRGLMLDVQNAFADTLAAKASLTLAQENLKALNDIVSINTTRVRAGDLAQVELIRSRLAALQFQNAVKQAELRLRTAKNRLQFLIGRTSVSDDFDVEGELRREPLNLGIEPLRTQAMRLRPDLLSVERDRERSAADLKLQVATGKVDYTIGSEYRRQQLPAYSNSMGIFLSVPLPVFNKNQGEIERATREGQQLALRVAAMKAAINAELEGAWQQYRTSNSLLESIEKDMIEQAKDVRATTEYSYRRGEASFVEFLDAQRAFNDTMQSYNDARADYARSLFLLDSISGKAVNP